MLGIACMVVAGCGGLLQTFSTLRGLHAKKLEAF